MNNYVRVHHILNSDPQGEAYLLVKVRGQGVGLPGTAPDEDVRDVEVLTGATAILS